MLADALYSHRSALSASLLAEYGIRLSRHDFSPLELADLVWELPDGCPLWQSVGGPRAWSQETQMLSIVEHQIRHLQWMQGKRNQKRPKRMEPPKYAFERDREARAAEAKADRWQQRQSS